MKFLLTLLSLLSLTLFQLDAQGDVPFITTWKTTTANESITIPIDPNYTYAYDIDWGDGSTQTNVSTSATHSYLASGTYQISITKIFPAIYINNSSDKNKLVSIDQWGNIEWLSMKSAFRGTSNMIYNATDKPDLSLVTDLSRMFLHAASFNGDVGDWEVENVSKMVALFGEAKLFNQDIGNWDMSNVTDISYILGGAEAFNQDIGEWDVSRVKLMYEALYGASSFNQDISSWKVDSVIGMKYLFERASSFNQDIGLWNVSNVTDMSYMFRKASSFNQDISSWDFSNATTMAYMFEDAVSFDQDISSWNIENVSSMDDMLSDSGMSQYNYDKLLSEWATKSVKPNVVFGADGLEYCFAEDTRMDLTNASMHNWTITGDTKNCDNAQPCTSTQSNTWEGTVSDDWNDAANWSQNTIPTVCDEVIIPAGSVTLSGDAECYSIQMEVGADVEVSAFELIVWNL